MDNYLLALGWWNLIGSVTMLGFLNESFGKNMLNKWTKIFKKEFTLDHWSRFWLLWAISLNIFFALINIFSVKWGYAEVKIFLVYSDIIAYLGFMILSIWGLKNGKCDTGIYSVFFIFSIWITWGILVII